jgi:hypothetical protein
MRPDFGFGKGREMAEIDEEAWESLRSSDAAESEATRLRLVVDANRPEIGVAGSVEAMKAETGIRQV